MLLNMACNVVMRSAPLLNRRISFHTSIPTCIVAFQAKYRALPNLNSTPFNTLAHFWTQMFQSKLTLKMSHTPMPY